MENDQDIYDLQFEDLDPIALSSGKNSNGFTSKPGTDPVGKLKTVKSPLTPLHISKHESTDDAAYR